MANFTTDPQPYLDNLLRKCPPHTIVKVFHQRAFPYIGNTALAYCAYLGMLFHHRYLTSNATNQSVDLWRSLLRLALSALLSFLFIWQLRFVDWSEGIIPLYFNKTVVPIGGAAFVLCSFAEPLFEHMGLMNRNYGKHRYCVFVHEVSSEKTQEILQVAMGGIFGKRQNANAVVR